MRGQIVACNEILSEKKSRIKGSKEERKEKKEVINKEVS